MVIRRRDGVTRILYLYGVQCLEEAKDSGGLGTLELHVPDEKWILRLMTVE
jgi:hypothetical protein